MRGFSITFILFFKSGARLLGGLTQHTLHPGVWYEQFWSCTLQKSVCFQIINIQNLCLAFCPYHIGHFSVVGLGFEENVSSQVGIMKWSLSLLCEFLPILTKMLSELLSGSCLTLWGTHHHYSWIRPVSHHTHRVPCILSDSTTQVLSEITITFTQD